MKIVIAGAGKVGAALVRQLAAEEHEITVIDMRPQALEQVALQSDVMWVSGNCAAKDTLAAAGIREARLLIAATGADEINLLCCATARHMNPTLRTIARIRNPQYAEQANDMRHALGLSMTVNPDLRAAEEAARLLKYPGFLKRQGFAKGRLQLLELQVKQNDPLDGHALMELGRIVNCRVLVCAVVRGETSYAPKGGFVLREGDRLFVTAAGKDMAILLRSLGLVGRHLRRVLICGGSRVSVYLAELLCKEGVSVEIIERDRDKCQQLAEALPKVSVINGNAGDRDLLEREGAADCDGLVALTGIDELNMIISLCAKNLGAPQTVTGISRTDNDRSTIHALNLGSILCAKELCSSQIVQYVRAMQNRKGAAVSVTPVADGNAEVLEFLADENTPYLNTPLKQLPIRENVLIAAISNGTQSEIACGDSLYRAGDTVLVVAGGSTGVHSFEDIFQKG